MTAPTHSPPPAPHARRGSSWASNEPHRRNYSGVNMLAAAAARAHVRLPDGRTGQLLYWPLPATRRRGRRPSSGGRPKILLGSGAVLTVHPADITITGHKMKAAA